MCLGNPTNPGGEGIITSSGTSVSMSLSNNKAKHRKIEEDYTMYEEVKDDELEDIIEEEIEEESEDERNDDLLLTSQEEREERKREREELKTLRT